MASKLTKQINSKFNPTSLSGYSVYALGGYPQMYGLGSFIGDAGKLLADNILSTFGASDVIEDSAYKTKLGKKVSSVTNPLNKTFGNIMAGMVGVQGLGQIGSSLNPQPETNNQAMLEEQKRQLIANLPAQQDYIPTFANGGELSYLPSITNFTTPINTDLTIEKNPMFLDRSRFRRMGPSFRVEANKLDEYIDNIAGHLNTHNFPQKEREAMQYRQSEFRKLKEDLFNYQENPDTKKFEFADGGSIHIKPENRGKFTAAAKSRGMGVQEFASKVLSNKENYSPILVKRANFAHNFAKENGGLLDSYAGGGNMNTFGTNLDNTTVYANGGTHESNPYSGIQIGNNSLVEENEVRFGDYIFSNRIPFKKK